MQQREDHDERIHQRIWELTPWYANGTLPDADRERVEDHAAGCRRCQEEIETCLRMAAAIKGLGEVTPSPHPVQLQRVLARIGEAEQAESRERTKHGVPRRTLAALVAAAPRPWRGALAAQAAIIVVLAGLLFWSGLRGARPAASAASAPPATYQTLSDPAPPPAAGGRVALHVMFSPRATEKEIRDLLLAVHGELTAGPSPFGVYTVEVAAAGHPASVVLTRLRSDSVVILAEPAAGGAPVREAR